MILEGIITHIILICSLAFINQKINKISSSGGDELWQNIKKNINLYIFNMNNELKIVSPFIDEINHNNFTNNGYKNVNNIVTRKPGKITINSNSVKNLSYSIDEQLLFGFNQILISSSNQLRLMFNIVCYITFEKVDLNYLNYSDLNQKEQNLVLFRQIWNSKNRHIEMSLSVKIGNNSGLKTTYSKHMQENVSSEVGVVFIQCEEKNCKTRLIIPFSMNKLIKVLHRNPTLASFSSWKMNPNQVKLYNRTICEHCVITCWIIAHWHFIIAFGPVSIVLLYKKCKVFNTFLLWLLLTVKYFYEIQRTDKNVLDNKSLFEFEKDMKENYGDRHIQKGQEIYENVQRNNCTCQKNVVKLKVEVDKLRLLLKKCNSELRYDNKRILFYIKRSYSFNRYIRRYLSESKEIWKEQKQENNAERIFDGQNNRQRGQGEITGVTDQIPNHVQYSNKIKRFPQRKLKYTMKTEDKQQKLINLYKKYKHQFSKKTNSLDLHSRLMHPENSIISVLKTHSDSALMSNKELEKHNFVLDFSEKQLTFDSFSLQANPLFKKQKSQHLETSVI